MTQNYLSGRVSRFAVGVPGFTTSGDLTLDVSGSLGIGTTQPRAEADVPNISIREQILDSVGEPGPLGYYLSVDVNGVRWAQPNPSSLNSIRLYEDGVQVGFNSANGLNFVSPDEFFVDIDQNSVDPNLADIKFNPGWVKFGYDNGFGNLNYGFSTSFGPDGTFWSLPGAGTSEASGITSIGIGTNRPRNDLQIGIGSTGVTADGETGTIKAVVGDFQNLKISGNIQAESLVIDPGIATFRGPIDAQGVSTFSSNVFTRDTLFSNEIETVSIAATNARAGILTVGIDSTTEALNVIGELDVLGFTTTTGNVFIAGILTVTERFDVPNIGVEFLEVSGIATINVTDGNIGTYSNFAVTGVTTLAQVGFNTGIGTALTLERGNVGFLTATSLVSTAATIGFSSLTDVVVVGVATVNDLVVEQIDIERATVGILTVEEGFVSEGLSTFVGFTTFRDDIYVAGFGTFAEGADIPFVQVQELVVTGIATINALDLNVGVAGTLFVEDFGAGVGTFRALEAGIGTIGGIDFPGGGELEGTNLDFDSGRIGILTGDLIQYGIGTITTFTADVAGINTIQSFNIFNSGDATIGDVAIKTAGTAGFLNEGSVTIPGTLSVENGDFPILGTAVQIKLGDVDNDPTVGLTTVAGDLYAGRDIYARGTLFSKNLGAEFLEVTGIATINQLEFAVGFGTTANFTEANIAGAGITNADITNLDADNIRVGILTVDLRGEADFFVIRGDTSLLRVESPADPNLTNARIETPKLEVEDVLRPGTGFAVIENLNVPFIGTINNFFSNDSDIERADIGIATVGFASITDSYLGVSTIGLASVTDIQSVTIDVRDATIGISTVGYTSIGTGSTADGAMYVVGVNTFVGFSTFSGDIFVDGNFTVTGIFSSFQLDGAQSQIGILTVFEKADLNGIVEAETVGISSDLTVDRLTTLSGFTTTSDVIVGGGLTVVGDTTFLGIVSITDTLFVNQEVTGISTVNNLEFNVGIGSTLTVGFLTATDTIVSGVASFTGFTTTSDVIIGGGLTVVGDTRFVGVVSITDTVFINQEVTGISTVNNLIFNVGIGSTLTVGFLTATDTITSGVATFNGGIDINADVEIDANVDITGKLVVDGDFGVTGLATFTDINVSSAATIGFANIRDSNLGVTTIGIASVGFATITDAFIGVGTINTADIGTLELTNLTVTGVSTFVGLATFGNIEYVDSLSTGIASFNQTGTGIASVGFATITGAWIGTSFIDEATIGLGASTEPALSVTGLSSFLGFTTFRGDVFVGGALTVTGIASYNQLDAKQSQIGILTVSTDLDVLGTLSVIGFSTLGDFSANSGVVTDLTIGFATVTGILTTNQLEITNDLTVNRNLSVLGITTLGDPLNPTAGFTTITGDLYVGGDLFVLDDIFYDEISGRNLNITGISTLNLLEFGIGVARTSLTANSLTYNTGVGTDLTVSNNLTNNNFTQLNNLNVLGIATLRDINAPTGIVTVQQLDVATINSTTINNTGLVTTRDLNASFSITAGVDLRSNGTLTVEGVSSLNDDVNIVGGDLGVTFDGTEGGNITAVNANLQTSTVSVAATFNGFLDVDSTNVTIAGLTTISNNVIIESGNLYIDNFIFANSGIITTLSGTTLTYETANIDTVTADTIGVGTLTANFKVSAPFIEATFASQLGIATANSLDVNGTINTLNLNANTGFVTTLNADTANINTGVATNFTVSEQFTSTDNNLTRSVTGIATITQQLDHTTNATTTDAQRASGNAFTTLYTVPAGFTSADFTITAVEGTNFQTVKIHALNDGTQTFHNEYSDLFNNGEVSVFDVVGGAGGMILTGSSISGNNVTYTTHAVLHKA